MPICIEPNEYRGIGSSLFVSFANIILSIIPNSAGSKAWSSQLKSAAVQILFDSGSPVLANTPHQFERQLCMARAELMCAVRFRPKTMSTLTPPTF